MILFIFSGCTLQKRLYRKGFYIENTLSVKHKNVSPIYTTRENKSSFIKESPVKEFIQGTPIAHKDSTLLSAATPPKKHYAKDINTPQKYSIPPAPLFYYFNLFQEPKVLVQDSIMKKKSLKKKCINRLVINTILSIPTILIYYYYYFYTLTYSDIGIDMLGVYLSMALFIALIRNIILLVKVRRWKLEKKYRRMAWIALFINIISLIFLLIPVVYRNYSYWF